MDVPGDGSAAADHHAAVAAVQGRVELVLRDEPLVDRGGEGWGTQPLQDGGKGTQPPYRLAGAVASGSCEAGENGPAGYIGTPG